MRHWLTRCRENVLRQLQKLTKELVQVVGRAKKLPAAILDTAGGKVFTYGSYSLGVYGPGSDIDTLVVAPKHVTREDFFKYFPDLLKNNVAASDITELTAVPDASVPIIKMELYGISIDLIFSNLQVASVPSSLQMTDNNLLRGLNEIDLRCVNGTPRDRSHSRSCAANQAFPPCSPRRQAVGSATRNLR